MKPVAHTSRIIRSKTYKWKMSLLCSYSQLQLCFQLGVPQRHQRPLLSVYRISLRRGNRSDHRGERSCRLCAALTYPFGTFLCDGYQFTHAGKCKELRQNRVITHLWIDSNVAIVIIAL